MTREERKLALYCLKASSDYHSEVCEECINYPNCDHMGQDDVTETIIKALEQEPILDKIRAEIKGKIEQEEFARSVFRHEEKDTAKAEQCTGSIMAYNNMIKLIDKYKAESEDKGDTE